MKPGMKDKELKASVIYRQLQKAVEKVCIADCSSSKYILGFLSSVIQVVLHSNIMFIS